MVETQTLTPTQFLVARALAKAYNHLWGYVPDKTYDVKAIQAWSMQNENSIPGIEAPWFNKNGWVVHTTGTGRLDWQISPQGSVLLTINRPDPEQQRINEAIASEHGNGAVEWCGHEVAHVTIFNGCLDEHDIGSSEQFTVGEIELASSDYAKTHDEDGQVKSGWNYYPPEDKLRDDLLFERHVFALIRPLVALLTIAEEEPAYPEYREEETEEERNTRQETTWNLTEQYRERVITPAIAKAKEVFQPLFDIALPDPWSPPRSKWKAEENPEPETCWLGKGENWEENSTYYTVVHRGERFPVESEKTAVHAVLLLQQQSEMPLVDAVKTAIQSKSYRPTEI